MMRPFGSSGCNTSKSLIGSSRELRVDSRVVAVEGLGPVMSLGTVSIALPPPCLLLLLVALPVVGIIVIFIL